MVAAFVVLRIGDAGEQRQIGRQVLAAVNAGRERTRRTERADAIVAIDLLVDPEQHVAEHAVGDHLVEALSSQIVDRAGARTGSGHRWRVGGLLVGARRRCRAWRRRRRSRRRWRGRWARRRRRRSIRRIRPAVSARAMATVPTQATIASRAPRQGALPTTAALRMKFAMVSARTACRWDRCRRRR